MAEILFETSEALADPSNPSHACCSACGNVQPIENFTRSASTMQAHRWGWDVQRDRKNFDYVGTACNACAAKKKKASERCFDYDAYDRRLKLSGRYEYKVEHPTKPHTFITKREFMVMAMREKRKRGQRKGGIKGLQTRFSTEYTALVKQATNEVARASAQLRTSVRLTEAATPYLEAYITHTKNIVSYIKDGRKRALKPKASPCDYINPNSKHTQYTRELYRQLTGVDRAHVAAKYL